MKVNEILHGFRLCETRELSEINAIMHRMVYEKNGAELVWLERTDDNMTFAITFKTIPQDDTGVFHIIEHSVLCGSEKYPVREPFVELIKSSLQTFLNAFTFPDKTMYPLCSRNKKDFLNLIDVYMDAVLHPISTVDPHAFRQEGWHYELEDAAGELKYNGVVFNEMKGAFASSDTVLSSEMNKLLFPDTCYRCESGGDPAAIPDLTYENYLASHARWYHPSNSRIFLDGSIDLDAVLEKLDSFLSKYERIDPKAEIAMQAPVCPEEHTCYYEIGADEPEENRAILAKGWVYGTYAEKEKNLAGAILTEALCGSNEAPLTKALMDAGLCEDVEFSQQDGIQQLYTVLVVRNCDASRKEEIWALVEKTLRSLAENGLDHKRLHAILNHVEFSTRERDYGSFPKGLVFCMTGMDSWLYGGDPAQNYSFDETFALLRGMIDEGGFEKLLNDFFVACSHTAKLCMLPSTTLGEEKIQRENERLQAEKATMTEADIARVMEEFRILREKQETEDSPEQLATLPQLSISDIREEVEPHEVSEFTAAGRKVLHYPINTSGISYAELVFDISDIPLEELSCLSFLCTLYGDVATRNYSAIELASELDAYLGRFDVHPTVFLNTQLKEECRPAVVVTMSMLETAKPDAVRLTGEILLHSLFADKEAVFNLLRQSRIDMEQRVVMSGNQFATIRSLSSRNGRDAVAEQYSGISMLRWLQETEKTFEQNGDAVCAKFAALAEKVFVRSRLTVAMVGALDLDLAGKFAEVFPDVPMGERTAYQPLVRKNEAFVIPASVGFAVKSGAAEGYSGSSIVMSGYLTYDYLWNSVRVQGGAYGTGLRATNDQSIIFSSYRDPQCARSLNVYDGAAQQLRNLAGSEESLDRYIISSIARTEPVQTPRSEGADAVSMWFNGVTTERRQKTRTGILHTTKADLLREADRLDQVCADAVVCVVGGKNIVEACGEVFDSVENIML